MKREALDIQMIARVIQMGASTSDEYFLDTETGEVILIPDEVLTAVENDESDSLRPSQRALVEKALEICAGNGRFVPIPHLSGSDIFSVVSRLAEKLDDPDLSDAIAEAMAAPDFVDRFEEICLSRPEVMEMFYELLDEHTAAVLNRWLSELGI